MLRTAIEAARRAGRAVADKYPTEREIAVKGYRDIVTDVDFIAERIVLETIRARYPDHTIISEEAGATHTDSPYCWVIDPIDGTTNYARRLPICAVSVGLLENEVPIVGVIHDPLRGDTFSAERGCGAYHNGARMAASQVETLADALVGFDWGHADDIRGRTLSAVNAVAPLCRTVRGLGSAVLALAYVAVGWLDAYLNLSMKPWDTTAGLVLLSEAGGHATAPDGSPFRFDCPACLATNGRIHAEILARLRPPDGQPTDLAYLSYCSGEHLGG